jgi:S-(hydroxymethyl)glutathione dehydrogenase/alcohol dehydrogenase
MSRKFKAAVLRKTGQELSIEEIESSSLSFGQVLVRLMYSGICRSQLMEKEGKRGEDKWLPHLLGHEGFGVVEEIGEGVSKCKPGDRVVLSWLKGKGIEANNPTYFDKLGKKINSGKVTTFSNYSVVSENRLFRAPQGFSDKFLPLFGCALLTGGGMAIKYGNRPEVKKACVIGFGGIGSAAALVLKGIGNLQVEIVEVAPEKIEMARKLGFIDIHNEIAKSSGDFDLIIEASGTISAIEEGFTNLSATGTLVFASHPEKGSKISLDPHELIKGKRIFGTWGGDINPDKDMKIIGELLAKSGANLDLLLGEMFSIDETNRGLAYLDSGKPGRPIMRLSEE